MYTYGTPETVLGELGAAQTGTIPQGSTVLVPKGTVVTVIDARYPAAPKTAPLSNATSLVLIGAAAVQGDVVGRDLVSVGGEATLAYETGMLPAPPEGQPSASGPQVNVPAGTKVTIQRLPSAAPQTSVPRSQSDCPAGWTFVPGIGPQPGDCTDPSVTCGATIRLAACNPPDGGGGDGGGGGGGGTTATVPVPWYKRGSTYVVAGGVLLLGVIVVAASRKG